MTRHYASAGAVIVTGHHADPRILLLDQARRDGGWQTVAPKGRIEPGEASLDAAIREAFEEAGVTGLTYLADLGRQVFSFIDADGEDAAKTVDWYLFATVQTTVAPAADEGFVAARWLRPAEARQEVSHAGFREVLVRAIDLLDGSLPRMAASDADAIGPAAQSVGLPPRSQEDVRREPRER